MLALAFKEKKKTSEILDLYIEIWNNNGETIFLFLYIVIFFLLLEYSPFS